LPLFHYDSESPQKDLIRSLSVHRFLVTAFSSGFIKRGGFERSFHGLVAYLKILFCGVAPGYSSR